MKKRKSFFERYLDEIYNVSEMLHKEGCSDGERRYKEVVAVIALFILENLRALLRMLACMTGTLLGLLLSLLLSRMVGS